MCGRQKGEVLVEITENPISPERLVEQIRKREHGAVVSFVGVVRSPSRGREVRYIEYEAFTEMARKRLDYIAADVCERWHPCEISIVHRVGEVKTGEASIVIVVAAPHRREAFAACQHAIDRIKETAPIWKKEVYTDGEEWVSEVSV